MVFTDASLMEVTEKISNRTIQVVGLGAVIGNLKVLMNVKASHQMSTNEAELTAIIEALTIIQERQLECSRIKIHTDSSGCIQTFKAWDLERQSMDECQIRLASIEAY